MAVPRLALAEFWRIQLQTRMANDYSSTDAVMTRVPDTPSVDSQQNPPDLSSKPSTSSKQFAWGLISRRQIAIAILVVIALAAIGWRIRITRPDYRLARGEEAIADSDWKSADRLANRLAASGRPNRLIFCGPSCSSRKQFDEAIGECNQIHDEGSIRLRAATLTGKSQLELGNLAEANRVFSFVVDHQTDNADAHRGLAAVAYEMGHLNRAIAQLELVVRLDPGDARPHRVLGECYRNSGDTEHAPWNIESHCELATASPRRHAARFVLNCARPCCCCIGMTKCWRCSTKRRLVHRSRPTCGPSALNSLCGLQRRPEAIALADEVLADQPDGAFYRLRGQLYLDEGNARAVLPLLEEAASFSPNHYQTQFLLAQAYAAAGRKSDADRVKARADQIRKDFELAAELAREATNKPWDPLVRLRLAALCEKSGDAKSAAQWRKAAAQCQGRRR